MTEECAYQNGGQMEIQSLTPRLQAMFKLMKFDFGSLWYVGEAIWEEKLPSSYVRRKDRVNHPGICLNTVSPTPSIHAAIRMWHGTTPKRESDHERIKSGRVFALRNFSNEAARGKGEHVTIFGYFSAVPIELNKIGTTPRLESDFDLVLGDKSKQAKLRMKADKERKLMSIVVPNDTGRQMSDEEKEEMRRFTRRFYSIG